MLALILVMFVRACKSTEKSVFQNPRGNMYAFTHQGEKINYTTMILKDLE